MKGVKMNKILSILILICSCMGIVGGFTGLIWELFLPGVFGTIIFTITLLAVSYRQPKNTT
jgi:hypothetical protein